MERAGTRDIEGSDAGLALATRAVARSEAGLALVAGERVSIKI